jgi:hypothetical protein
MAGYVPWYGKKREGLKRREHDLLRLLGRGEGPEAVVRAAEEVRAARIRALRSDRSRIPPCGRDDYDERSRRFDEEIARWSSLAVEAIVAEYRRRLRPANSAHQQTLSDARSGSGDS